MDPTYSLFERLEPALKKRSRNVSAAKSANASADSSYSLSVQTLSIPVYFGLI
jgi:hypothetical protein